MGDPSTTGDNNFPASDTVTDEEMSALDETVPEPPKTADDRGTGAASDFDSALCARLLNIDCSEILSIHHFFDYREDPVIKEYISNLVDLNFVPTTPRVNDASLITTPELKCKLPILTVEQVISLLMCFFQTRNFYHNMISATAHGKSVINVNQKPFMPAFQFTPLVNLKKVTDIKTSFAMQLQGVHSESAEFIGEFLVIRAAKLIQTEVKKFLTDLDQIKEETQGQLDIIFYRSKMEFVRKFSIKNIDWDKYESKAKHTEPNWRKKNEAVPTEVQNKYASELIKRVRKGEDSIDTSAVKKDYSLFLDEGQRKLDEAKEKFKRTTTAATSTSSSSSSFPSPGEMRPPTPSTITQGQSSKRRRVTLNPNALFSKPPLPSSSNRKRPADFDDDFEESHNQQKKRWGKGGGKKQNKPFVPPRKNNTAQQHKKRDNRPLPPPPSHTLAETRNFQNFPAVLDKLT